MKEQPEVTGSEKVLGLSLKPLDAELRQQFEIGKNLQGLFVADIEHDSDAAKRGMSPGDVINSANNQPVMSVSDFKKAIASAKDAGRKFILLRILRGNDTAFVTLPVE
ncbi:MAG: PDZ domain-containing protein [Rickettsiales bacterium]